MSGFRMIAFLCLWLSASLALAAKPYCTADAAFGETFGGSRIHGTVLNRSPSFVSIADNERFSPFKDFLIQISPTGIVYSVMGEASFTDAASAQTFINSTIASFSADPGISERIDDPPTYITLYTGKEGSTEVIGKQQRFFHTDGLKIEIHQSPKHHVTLDCSNLKAEIRNVNERIQRMK
ncbi:MAG: hypothetical protein ACREVL_02705 [Solimonas sp.]